MSRVRQPSEWGIGKVKTLFSYLEYKVFTDLSKYLSKVYFFSHQKSLRVVSMPLGMIFLVASHLTNLHTTIYGSQVIYMFRKIFIL